MTPADNSFTLPALPGAAIACDMTEATDTPEERLAEYGRLFAHALVARDRVDRAVVFTLAAKPGVRDWLLDLLRREAACCPFFSFKVEDSGEEIVWTTSTDAGPAAEAMLDELFAGPDHFDDGFGGLLTRLAEREVSVVADGPKRFVIAE